MSPNCFLLPFLFLFFLSSSVQGDLKAIPTGIHGCPSYDCGNGEQVVYPFWVGDRSANSTSFCGYPNLKLTCEDDKPSLTTLSGSYTVSSINATTRTLTLVDNDVVGQTCPRARHNVSFGDKPLTLGNSTSYLVFCFNSTVRKPLPELVGAPVFPIDCLDDTKGPFPTYVFEEANVDSPELAAMLDGACPDGFAWYPVSKDDVSDKNLSSYFGKAMNNGFEVSWENLQWVRYLRCERSGGRCGYHNKGQGFEFQCFCQNGIHPNGDCHGGDEFLLLGAPNDGWKIGLAVGGVFLGLAFAGCGGFVYRRKYRTSSTSNCLSNGNSIKVFLNSQLQTLAVKQYTYAQVKKMTKGFKEQLGQGGYGTVYKGRISDGSLVAVKILRQTNRRGEEEEFINEVCSIGRTNHVNVVTLLGFCSQGSRRALIYEFMPNGSLDKFLFAADAKLQTFLGWEKLHNIAIGIASGLEYLHGGCKTPMLHFDIKPHNILLDEDLCPKISDFGLAKFYKPEESILSSMACARGTIGYIAPEVFSRSFGAVSSKSDVYSYGMVILEMVGRRRNVVDGSQNTSAVYFPHWIYEHLDEYCAGPQETVDSIEGGNSEIARRMALVGLWCIQTSPTSRPSISRVLEMLKGDAGNLAIPPKPYICSPQRSGRCNNIEDIATFTFSSSG